MSPEPIYVSSDDESSQQESIAPQKRVVIVLDSDDDEPVGSSTASPAPVLPESSLSKTLREAREEKKAEELRKASQSNRDDPIEISGSEDEERYAAYELNDSNNWQSAGPGLREGMSGRDLQQEIQDLSEDMVTLMPFKRRERGKAAVNNLYIPPASGPSRLPYTRRKTEHIWTTAQRDLSDRARRSRTVVGRASRWSNTPAARFLVTEVVAHPKFSPGSVNCIAQADGLVAVASCTLGGNADDEEDSRANRPYNIPGSLKVIWNDDPNEAYTLSGHEDLENIAGDDGAPKVKYYTVNEVQFDPANPTRLASCGRDKRVIIWDCDATHTKPGKLNSMRYENVPEGLQYKPTGTTFVTWTSCGEVGLHKDLDQPRMIKCTPKPEPIQSLLWGRGRLEHMIYLTTEVQTGPPNRPKYAGSHVALDVELCRPNTFRRKMHGGQCLDMNSTGSSIAHATRANNGTFNLSILDTRTEHRAVGETELPIFDAKTESPSIMQILFSPDSLYLAVARSDNVSYVYDTRFLDKGYLYDLPHQPPVAGSEVDAQYGVPKIEWFEHPKGGLSLVSCGADGCVRLWDMKRAHAPDADTVIARADSYAGWFSLGDTYKRERALVLGDGSGDLVIKK